MIRSAQHQQNKKTVLIFRQNLFRPSETFIPSQTQNLKDFTPLYIGRVQFGPTPKGQNAFSIWPFSPKRPTAKDIKRFAASLFSLSPKTWLGLIPRQAHKHIKLIHAHFGPDAVRALSLAEYLNVPLITNFHGFDATLDEWRYLTSPVWFPYPFLKKKLACQGNLFLCPSQFIRDLVLNMGFPEERTFVHHIGIDLEKFSLRPPEMEENYILHVARLVPGKGTATLIRALSILPERHKKVKLISIGAGSLRKKLEKLSADLNVAENIQFLGACSHETVKEWTSRSALAVLPSVQAPNKWREGLGLALVEAAACGLPVIGSNIGGIPEAMIPDETGFLFPPGDHIALAKKITCLLDDKALRIKMGRAGRKFVEKEFSLTTQNKALEALYNSLL